MVYLKSGFNPLAPTLGGKDEEELRDTLRLPAGKNTCTFSWHDPVSVRPPT
jgi:hypothetical protein